MKINSKIVTQVKLNKILKMSTSEEVYSLYERNHLLYTSNCINEKIVSEKNNYLTNHTIKPITIGDSSIPCCLHVKCYIRQGEECPICLENIMLKKDAFLTGCGHAFHRHCLLKMFENKWNQKLFSALKCPMCRCGLGFPTLLERYISSENHLDELENFWLTKDFQMPHYCTNIKEYCVHYLGMNKACYKCKDYVENG